MKPYEILNINKYSSTDEIRKAYNRLIKKHHPDSGDGDVHKLEEVKIAYAQLQTIEAENLVIKINVSVSQSELASFLGKIKTVEYDGIYFHVKIPYHTRINDTITVKNILPNITLKIKFKEYHE